MNLTCSALAEPGAQFIWIKDNETLNNSSFVTISNSDHHSVLQVHLLWRSIINLDIIYRNSISWNCYGNDWLISCWNYNVTFAFCSRSTFSTGLYLEVTNAELPTLWAQWHELYIWKKLVNPLLLHLKFWWVIGFFFCWYCSVKTHALINTCLLTAIMFWKICDFASAQMLCFVLQL